MEGVLSREPREAADEAVKQVHPLVADLLRPRPLVYYADLFFTAGVGWGALLLAGARFPRPEFLPLLLAAAVALYRGGIFVHEITHIRPGTVPGFTVAWNALVGVPLLLPSLTYVGVHGVHHAKAHYGTPRDPEYLAIGGWPAWKVALWVAHAALLPLALVLRFLVLAPLSLLHPKLRALVWGRASSLSVNPGWVRAPPAPGQRAAFAVQEAACFAWAAALAALCAWGVVRWRYVLVGAVAAALVGVMNQLRTAAAHRFRHRGDEAMSFEDQFLDSVNVPGNPVLTELWAPVGLRYHALHHLLPGLPYHNLGIAHRRVAAALPATASYHRATEASLRSALRELVRPDLVSTPARPPTAPSPRAR
jgi:fatty acid desaturase